MSALPNDVRQLRDYGDSLADAVADAGAQASLNFDPLWSDVAWSAIVELARSGREFTASDVRLLAGSESSPGAMGAAFRAASNAKLIRLVRYERSHRVTRHGGIAGVWRGRT